MSKKSRRSFLTGAAAAATSGVSILSLAQGAEVIPGFDQTKTDVDATQVWKPFSDRKVRVGIVGHGVCKFGLAFELQHHPNVELVAVSDLFPDRCAEMAQMAKCSKTYPSLETINDIRVFRREQRRYEEAESLLRQALEGRRLMLSQDNPDCLESMHELAVLYKEQDDYAKAEPLLIEAVKGRRLKLGDTHPHTLESWHNLIDLYEVWDKPEKANEWRAKLPQTETVNE